MLPAKNFGSSNPRASRIFCIILQMDFSEAPLFGPHFHAVIEYK